MMDSQIDAVARAFYNTQDCARGWDQEPEWLKEQFLILARSAMDILNEQTLGVCWENLLRAVSEQDH
jgi:hypothetical protein